MGPQTMTLTLLLLLPFGAAAPMPAPARVSELHAVSDSTKLNERPIIGIATAETGPKYNRSGSYVLANYIKYLQQAGARVVPVWPAEPEEYYVDMFSKLNGLLIPGGISNVTHSFLARTARIFYNLTLEAYDSTGEVFPMWGTCLGFQLLNVITAGEDVRLHTDSKNLSVPLVLRPGYRYSRMLGQVPDDVLEYLTEEPITQNNHIFSLPFELYGSNQKLNEFYHVLSTNTGRQGIEFATTIEAYRYPIYATQWHPEKSAFYWTTDYYINHSPHAIRAAQYFANFFVNEARKSTHRFPSAEEEVAAVINNYNTVFFTDGTYDEGYFFNTGNPALIVN